jgi:hypothetical protein
MHAALFEIDHTLIAADSGMLFMRYLLDRGELKHWHLIGPLYDTLLHRLNLLDINLRGPANPDRLLRRHARRQGWPIVTVRRDDDAAALPVSLGT